MNLHALLGARAAAGKPLRVGLIGAGKFGAMFLAQARRTPGLHLLGVADLSPERARAALKTTGWPEERIAAPSFAKALADGSTRVTDDALALVNAPGLDVVIEATGAPEAGIRHALACFERGRDLVMVNVEADVLAGPLLARRAREAGVVYSLAYGDQPALICEQVDWARACGFDVVAAGKGTLYMPQFHESTPDTVWTHYGLTPERAKASGLNAKMFNSFLDGTKSAIEMAAVANATGLTPAPDGLGFPPCAVDKLAETLIPMSAGGALHHKGQVEVVSSRGRDGRDLANNLRWGVYVVFEAPSEYVERCFSDYGLITDRSGRYAALWRPYHLIGLELGISVATVGLLKMPTGVARGFNADVVATAKRDLAAGEILDGEGGHTVWGRLMPAQASLARRALPIGLAHGVKLARPIPKGQAVAWADLETPPDGLAVKIRRDMERAFAP
ncbi:MAG: flagellar biosynthesis protein FlgA [Acidimicrobiia bacterium]|nr:flagellar biosynthesis protein FlgA [Acidimicrobiia bacterium]